jgi:CRP-like cAMP-binding protein
MEELLAYLYKHYPHPLSGDLLLRLHMVVKSRIVKKKDFLLKEGAIARYIYFIRSGLLRCFYTKGEKEVTSWLLKEDNVVVAVLSFYDQHAGFENIQAVEETEVLYISYDELEMIYKEYPEFNYIGRVLTIEYLKFWTMQLYNLRMCTARERFKLLMKEDTDLFLRVPQIYLASYLGMIPETFSRMKALGPRP